MENESLTAEEIEILGHTADRAANGFFCGNSDAMQSLVAAGMMESAGRVKYVPDEYFLMTAAGRRVLITIRSFQNS